MSTEQFLPRKTDINTHHHNALPDDEPDMLSAANVDTEATGESPEQADANLLFDQALGHLAIAEDLRVPAGRLGKIKQNIRRKIHNANEKIVTGGEARRVEDTIQRNKWRLATGRETAKDDAVSEVDTLLDHAHEDSLVHYFGRKLHVTPPAERVLRRRSAADHARRQIELQDVRDELALATPITGDEMDTMWHAKMVGNLDLYERLRANIAQKALNQTQAGLYTREGLAKLQELIENGFGDYVERFQEKQKEEAASQKVREETVLREFERERKNNKLRRELEAAQRGETEEDSEEDDELSGRRREKTQKRGARPNRLPRQQETAINSDNLNEFYRAKLSDEQLETWWSKFKATLYDKQGKAKTDFLNEYGYDDEPKKEGRNQSLHKYSPTEIKALEKAGKIRLESDKWRLQPGEAALVRRAVMAQQMRANFTSLGLSDEQFDNPDKELAEAIRYVEQKFEELERRDNAKRDAKQQAAAKVEATDSPEVANQAPDQPVSEK